MREVATHLLRRQQLCDSSLEPIRKSLSLQQVPGWWVYDPISSNQIFIVSCCSLLRHSSTALWWINMPRSENSSECSTSIVHILKFSIACWGKRALGNIACHSGSLKTREINRSKIACEMFKSPWWTSWSHQLVVTSGTQLSTSLHMQSALGDLIHPLCIWHPSTASS